MTTDDLKQQELYSNKKWNSVDLVYDTCHIHLNTDRLLTFISIAAKRCEGKYLLGWRLNSRVLRKLFHIKTYETLPQGFQRAVWYMANTSFQIKVNKMCLYFILKEWSQ